MKLKKKIQQKRNKINKVMIDNNQIKNLKSINIYP